MYILALIIFLVSEKAFEMIIGMSFTYVLFIVGIGNPRWPPLQYID
jgi:hypothetical protein